MKRETVQSDKAALKKEYRTVLQIMMKMFDTGQRTGTRNVQTHDLDRINQGQQLLNQFRAFGQHCLQRDSQFSQLRREHENLVKKYREKIKENKRMHKDFQEQSELLEKREKQVYRLSMRKIKKSEIQQRETKQESFTKSQQEIKTQEKSIQSEQTFQRMDETIKRLQREKEQLKVQLEQSRNLYRDKTIENESIKILLQKLVEDHKINGFDDENENQPTEIEEAEDFGQSQQNSSDVQSYVSSVFQNQNEELEVATTIIKKPSLDKQFPPQPQSQKQGRNIQNSSSTGCEQKNESQEIDCSQDAEEMTPNASKQEIQKLNLLWKACFRARNFIEKFLLRE